MQQYLLVRSPYSELLISPPDKKEEFLQCADPVLGLVSLLAHCKVPV